MHKKFNLCDVILSVICVVFVAEATAPVASLGNTQFFWRIFMIVAFLVPYGLISCELGTTYPGGGGLYDWVKLAFPKTRWAARTAWYYWLNFPLWMASLAVMVPDLIAISFGIEIGTWMGLAIQLIFILIVTIIACYPVCDSVIILNVCAVIKVGLALLVGGMGVFYVIRNGFAIDMSFSTFLPRFDIDSLSSISVIIFTMMGFEVVCTFSDDMNNPKKQLPQAIVIGGLVIAAVYLIGGFGICAAVEPDKISSDTGLIDAVQVMRGRDGGFFIGAVSMLFLVTLFGNMISWSLGANNTACYAAERNDMPAVFTKRWSKNGMPVGAVFINCAVAAIVCILGVVIKILSPGSQLFWAFFATNMVLLLLSYVPIFPAFLKLRKTDAKRERPFKVPGGKLMLNLMAYSPLILILLSVVFCAVPMAFDRQTLGEILPITIGSVVCIVMGDLLAISREKKVRV